MGNGLVDGRGRKGLGALAGLGVEEKEFLDGGCHADAPSITASLVPMAPNRDPL